MSTRREELLKEARQIQERMRREEEARKKLLDLGIPTPGQAIDRSRNKLLQILDYPSGIMRTGLASLISLPQQLSGEVDFSQEAELALQGKAPPASELYRKTGLPQGPSAELPVFGETSVGDVGATAVDLFLPNPAKVAANRLGPVASRAARYAAGPVTETIQDATKKLGDLWYRLPFKRSDAENIMQGHAIKVSDVAKESGLKGDIANLYRSLDQIQSRTGREIGERIDPLDARVFKTTEALEPQYQAAKEAFDLSTDPIAKQAARDQMTLIETAWTQKPEASLKWINNFKKEQQLRANATGMYSEQGPKGIKAAFSGPLHAQARKQTEDYILNQLPDAEQNLKLKQKYQALAEGLPWLQKSVRSDAANAGRINGVRGFTLPWAVPSIATQGGLFLDTVGKASLPGSQLMRTPIPEGILREYLLSLERQSQPSESK